MNVEDLYRLLRTSHVQAQGIVDTIADPLLVLDENLRVQSASLSFYETFKVDRYETIGQHLFELGNGQWNIPDLRLLLSLVIPKSTAVINYEVEHDFRHIGKKTMLLTARTLHHPDKSSHFLLLSIVDATERSRSDAAKDMLFGELRHRMKNVLAVAQSIARRTTTEGRTAAEYRDAFLGRFDALIETEDLAFSEQGETKLDTLLQRVLAPHNDHLDAVVIDRGAPVALGPSTIMSLSLVLHELATNAAKYGALSVPGGKVRFGWSFGDNKDMLRFTWSESGGPRVKPPTKKGFGVQMMEYAIVHGLGGQFRQDYAPDGFMAEFVIPIGSKPASG